MKYLYVLHFLRLTVSELEITYIIKNPTPNQSEFPISYNLRIGKYRVLITEN